MKKKISIGLILILLLTGCAKGTADMDEGILKEKNNLSESQRFDEYTEQYFREDIVENTIDLHYTLAYPENYGIDEYSVTLGDYDLGEMEDYEEEMLDLKKDLESFNRDKLTESQQLTYDILMDYVELELSTADLYLYSEPLDPINGYQSLLPILLAEYTFRREKDIEDYLILLGEVDDVFEDIIEFEKEKVKAGLFMPDFAVEDLVDQCNQFIENPEENYMIEVFEDKIDEFEGLSEEEKEAYKEQNKGIILTQVIPGYKMLIEEMESLKGNGRNDKGICYYEDGARYYEYLVRAGVGSDASISQLQTWTEDFISSREDWIIDAIINDPELYYDLYLGEEDTFSSDAPEAIMEYLIENTQEDFPLPPDVDYTIKYVHPSMEEHESPAFYLTPPIDDVENNVIYVNRRYRDEDLFTILAHEGYPGHLYQSVIYAQNDMPLIRNLFSCTGYVEGWVDYVEYYSYGLKDRDEELSNILAWDAGINVAICAYIDMGVNYDGWDRADVLAYLEPYGATEEEDIEELYELVVEKPAYYLNYFVGYLEFLRLREKAENALGEDFVLRDFHQFVLEIGPAPFYIIEDRMDVWLEEQK